MYFGLRRYTSCKATRSSSIIIELGAILLGHAARNITNDLTVVRTRRHQQVSCHRTVVPVRRDVLLRKRSHRHQYFESDVRFDRRILRYTGDLIGLSVLRDKCLRHHIFLRPVLHPKYFAADFSVSTNEYGSVKAVFGLPMINGNVKMSKNVLSAATISRSSTGPCCVLKTIVSRGCERNSRPRQIILSSWGRLPKCCRR